MKNRYKLFFLCAECRKMTPKLVVLYFWKKLHVLEKKAFFKKKILPAYLEWYYLQNIVWKLFYRTRNNRSRNVLFFGDFPVLKFDLYNKIINKMQTTKIIEISHTVLNLKSLVTIRMNEIFPCLACYGQKITFFVR